MLSKLKHSAGPHWTLDNLFSKVPDLIISIHQKEKHKIVLDSTFCSLPYSAIYSLMGVNSIEEIGVDRTEVFLNIQKMFDNVITLDFSVLILLCFFWSFSLFVLGLVGITKNEKNLIILLVCIEIMMLGINLNFIFASLFFSLNEGQIYALICLSLSAAEAAIGFGLLVGLFQRKKNITFKACNSLRGGNFIEKIDVC